MYKENEPCHTDVCWGPSTLWCVPISSHTADKMKHIFWKISYAIYDFDKSFLNKTSFLKPAKGLLWDIVNLLGYPKCL